MSRYYEPEDYERMRDATTFEEILQIAFGIIERMPDEVVMVSGPISTGGLGDRDANVARFSEAIAALERDGWQVFDQMPMEEHFWRIMEDATYYRADDDHLLEAFYGRLFASGLVRMLIMLPGWTGSYGARWEQRRAQECNMSILYLGSE